MIPLIVQALKLVVHPRFFENERGFQGQFQAHLQHAGAAPVDAIVEEEHQKTIGRHGITRRPDIIIHVPTPDGGNVRLGNFAVFALKRRASAAEAADDFEALDDMIDALDYQLAVFVNVDDTRTHSAEYAGTHQDRLHFFAIRLENGTSHVRYAHFENGQRVENDV